MPEPLSGVVLAGGRSTRMGRDKAFLRRGGETLVRRQTGLLRAAGCTDVLISGRPGVDYGVPDARTIIDAVENAGPLAGLVAALEAMHHERLLVLAVDLPAMSPQFLQRLAAWGDARCGVVPYGPHGFEPLGACLPRAILALARTALERQSTSLQTLLGEAESSGLIRRLALSPEEERSFENWNRPEDVGE